MIRVASLRRPLAWSLLSAVAAAQTLLAEPARADSSPAPAASTAPPQPPSPKRPLPDYRGRPPPPVTAGEVALWIPRIVLSPLYFVSEYVLRQPLGVLVPAAERIDLPRKVYDFFTFGPDHKAGIVPVGYVEFAFNPSVGLYFFWNDAGFDGNDLHAHVEAWPDEWIAGNVVQRIALTKGTDLQLRVAGLERPDKVFYGLGPSSIQSNQSRYRIQKVEGYAWYEWRYWRSSRILAMVGARNVNTADGHYGNDPSLTQEAATGAFPIPYGFGLEYTAQSNQLMASIDSREASNRPAPGARIEVAGEQDSDLRHTNNPGWFRYGATVAGYVDLNGYGRILGLSLNAQFVDPMASGGQIPFTELVYLGNDRPMPAFYDGRLRDYSAATATVSYTWPVAAWIDGDLQVDVGNVFGEHLSGFAADLMRLSFAFGLALVPSKDAPFQESPVQLLLGVGTETFQHGTQPDAFRLSFGVPTSF